MTKTLKEEIIEESKRLGIDKIGFTTAEPFDYLKESLEEQKAAGHTSGFEHPVIEERLYLEKTFDRPQSIIAIALAYPTKIHEEVPKDEKRGQFARASWGIDYHDILRDRLNQLITFIQSRASVWQQEEAWRFAPQVDTGELVDVAVAQRCLSYQTQTKGLMPNEYRKKMRNVIYGCDICQLVCPYNQGKDFHFHEEMEPKVEEVYPKLKPMLSLSNKEFKQQFGHLAGSWRGKKPLQRNALIALANLGDTSALPEIESCLSDVRPVIRATAAWSIGRLGRKEPEKWLETLEQMKQREEDQEVITEIIEAQEMLAKKTKRKKRT